MIQLNTYLHQRKDAIHCNGIGVSKAIQSVVFQCDLREPGIVRPVGCKSEHLQRSSKRLVCHKCARAKAEESKLNKLKKCD